MKPISKLSVLCATAAIAVAACAVGTTDDHDAMTQTDDLVERGSSNEQTTERSDEEAYYIVTRPDLRKCMYPMCGGVFVKQLNAAQTECLDGTVAEDCYVADIDFDALALDDKIVGTLSNAADVGQAIVFGKFETLIMQSFQTAVLVASQGWLGRAQSTPSGDFYAVKTSGIVCVTWPCPSLTEQLLNTDQIQNIHGLDLAASGASQAAIADAQQSLATAILVAGNHQSITGPAGDGTSLVATEFYTVAAAATTSSEPCGQGMCDAGEFCCNPSCGICAPIGGACIEIACIPCAHPVCDTGPKLNAGCDQCVKAVCDADPYCCNTYWDSLCVGGAENLCGSCQDSTTPDPQPALCAHSECEQGVKLAVDCSDCANDVCTADPYCCNTEWDSLCVDQAEDLCPKCAPAQTGCAHSECVKGIKLESDCSDCAGTVCTVDPYCCNNSWDNWCVKEAKQLCSVC